MTTFDNNDNAVVVDICNYKTAWAIRRLTEEFIAVKLVHDLDIFENITTEKERMQNEKNRLNLINKAAQKSLAPQMSLTENQRFQRMAENFSFLFDSIPPAFF